MVCRLIKQKQIGVRKQQPCKLRLVALPSAEGIDAPVQLLLRKSEPEQRRTRARAVGGASEVVITAREPVLTFDKPFAAFGIGASRQLVIYFVKLLFYARKLRKDLQHIIIQG